MEQDMIMIYNQLMVIECFKRGGQHPREERSDTRRAAAVKRSCRGAAEKCNGESEHGC